MRIVFGWNSFKIKSFSPFELGLSKTIENDFSIELRQSYFHFFWIPFFGIGKKWTIRKGGKLYEVPAVYKDHIRQQQLPARTPWYTFAGPLLIVAGFIIYGINQQVEGIQSARYRKNSYENKVASLTEQLAHINNHDYYWLQEKGASGSNVLLKVNEVKGNDIVFSMLTTGLSDYELSPLKMQYLFDMKGDAAEKISISKQKMQSAISLRYEDADKGADVLGDGRRFLTRDIYHLDGPLLADRGTGGMSNASLSIDILNRGWPGTLTKITNLSGGYKWTNDLPQEIGSAQNDYDYGGQFHLRGTNETSDRKYKVELTMLDSLQKEHKYIVEGEGFRKTVKQVY